MKLRKKIYFFNFSQNFADIIYILYSKQNITQNCNNVALFEKDIE